MKTVTFFYEIAKDYMEICEKLQIMLITKEDSEWRLKYLFSDGSIVKWITSNLRNCWTT